MKCILCPEELDELTPAEPPDSLLARLALAARLSAWRQVTVCVEHIVVHAGHMCPAHSPDSLQLKESTP